MTHELLLILILAFLLDAIIGDPETKYHPVRGIGWLIRRGEAVLYRRSVPKRLGGIILVIGTIAITLGAAIGVSIFLFHIAPAAGVAWNVAVVFFCLAFRSLIDSGERVARDLDRNDIGAAKKHLSWIVSRDTDGLDEADIIRGTIESLSENLNDAVIAPLFYAFIFGMPGIVFYKAVNTLDSMVGYKTDRYLKFGWASARLDDIVNFIPARIALLLAVIAAGLLRGGKHEDYDAVASWRTAIRYGQSGESPNGGLGICAFAGALRVTLGGTNFFDGEAESTPTVPPVGAPSHPFTVRDIRRAERLIAAATLIGFMAGVALLMIV